MNQKLERGIEALFDTSNAVRQAELAGDEKLTQTRLREGLIMSCEILEFMLSDSVLKSAHPRPEGWKSFELLISAGKLDEFLNAERKILQSLTNLRHDVVEVLLSALRQVILVTVKRRGRLDASWMVSLSQLASVVCESKSVPEPSTHWKPFLTRAFLAAGGGFVAAVNVIVGSSPQIQPAHSLLQYSIDAGIWLIAWAATGMLDKWVDHQSSDS